MKIAVNTCISEFKSNFFILAFLGQLNSLFSIIKVP